jgi:capsular exopolysaccharide synthesis family protein
MKRNSITNLHTYAYPSILKDAPFQFVETFNSLRTNIRFASVSRQYKKIVITSSISGEGKSTVAINLAIALANSSSRVLLIDCDLRKPAIHNFLQIDSEEPGLTTALAGIVKIEQCIIHMKEMGMDVLTSGPVPPNPAELLGSDKMSEIIESISKQYDYILFDTPPVSVVTDAAVLSKISDGFVFVVRHLHTKIEEAVFAKSNLEKVGATVIGTVLNAFIPEKSSKSYAGYHYKQNEYGYKNISIAKENMPEQAKAFSQITRENMT